MSRVRGWCPSAHRPMPSGDGLLVRVRPPMARMTVEKCGVLADLCDRFGNGQIDLTTRGNLQIRGVRESEYSEFLGALIDAVLVEEDPSQELPLTVTPFPDVEGVTAKLIAELSSVAPRLPELPGKIGIVVDTGKARFLQDVSGDFRFERASDGLILRADGSETGREATLETAGDALVEMAEWFVRSGGTKAGRMRRHLVNTPVPDHFQGRAPDPNIATFAGPDLRSGTVGLIFGRISASGLRSLCAIPEVRNVTFAPWRAVILSDQAGTPLALDAAVLEGGDFLSDASDPLAAVDACPGSPDCEQATVTTRGLARALSKLDPGVVHISGCAKGCARQTTCPVTLVGHGGRFDVIVDGRPDDTPLMTGLSEADVIAYFEARRAPKPRIEDRSHISAKASTT